MGVEPPRIAFTIAVVWLIPGARAAPARFCQPMVAAASPGRNKGVLPGRLGAPLSGHMPGVQFSWFMAGFACGLSPGGPIRASSTTCAEKWKIKSEKKEQIAPRRQRKKRGRGLQNLHKPLETEQIWGVAPRRPVCRTRD